MAIKGYFLDNEKYFAEDVNRAFSYLTTGGVSVFFDTGNTLSDINSAVSELASEGVDSYNAESCKVYKSGDIYKVKKGVCFLPDGALISVDDDEITIDISEGEKNYIYAGHDLLKNECKVYVSNEAGGQNTVPLAEIDENGKITDKRIFSMAKIGIPSTNLIVDRTITFNFPDEGENYVREITLDMGFSGFHYVMATGEHDVRRSGFHYIGDGSTIETIYEVGNHARVNVRKEGASLILTLISNSQLGIITNFTCSFRVI